MYDENDLKNIGTNIRLLRIQNKMEQQMLAKALGVSQTHMSNMEHGRANVNLRQLICIANIFNRKLEDFLINRIEPEISAPKEEDGYSAEEVRRLLELLKMDRKNIP